jgi:hypothetical protein
MKPMVTRFASLLAAALLAACGDAAPPSASVPPVRPSFTGLWQVADPDVIVKPEDDDSWLTEEGLRRQRDFKENFKPERDDKSNFCVPHGMPWMMLSRARDYLTDIYQTEDRVTLLLEGMDAHRLVRLDQSAVPEAYAPGTTGYSLGRWDGDTLVIETTHLRPTNVGRYQRSEQMRIIERWRFIEHPELGKALEVRMEVTDPVIFKRPAPGYALFVPAPDGSVLNAYGCPESRFDDYIEKVRRDNAQSR